MGMFWEKENKPEENRFKEIYCAKRKTSSFATFHEFIIQDQETGILYYQTVSDRGSGNANISTIPLLDLNGKPMIGDLKLDFEN